MRHLRCVSKAPKKAQITGLCGDNIDTDYEATLCFLLNILVGFLLPVVEAKYPSDN